MSFFVICTFDLKNAQREQYQTAYEDLERIGLKGVVVADNQQKLVMPTTTTAGHFNGANAVAVRDYVANAVQVPRKRPPCLSYPDVVSRSIKLERDAF